jgi:hypothetical protein
VHDTGDVLMYEETPACRDFLVLAYFSFFFFVNWVNFSLGTTYFSLVCFGNTSGIGGLWKHQ